MPDIATQEAPAKKRMLFNRSGMAYILKPLQDGGEKRIFAVQTALEPADIMYGNLTEEKFLLDYFGVVYADKMMSGSPQVAALEAKVKELNEENAKLRGSLAAGVGKAKIEPTPPTPAPGPSKAAKK